MGKTRRKAAPAPPLPLLNPADAVVVGIDPGLEGGVAIVHEARVVACHPMPTLPYDGRDWPDAIALARLLSGLGPGAVAFVERSWVHRGNDSRSVFRFGAAYGAAVAAAAEACELVVPVDPQEWQGIILPGVSGRSHLKRASVEFCRRRWPSVNLVPHGCRTPHDGMGDALCLASYGQARLCGTLNTHHNPEPACARPSPGRRKG